jgi:threonine dehydrogenase-like Zn-dependent dehydrogenase
LVPASSVAVFGAGTIGLLAAYSSLLRGASEVCVIDFVRDRLVKAAEIGATAVDLSAGDPVDQVRELRRSRQVRPTCETWSLPVGQSPVPTEMVRLPIRGADLIATTPE